MTAVVLPTALLFPTLDLSRVRTEIVTLTPVSTPCQPKSRRWKRPPSSCRRRSPSPPSTCLWCRRISWYSRQRSAGDAACHGRHGRRCARLASLWRLAAHPQRCFWQQRLGLAGSASASQADVLIWQRPLDLRGALQPRLELMSQLTATQSTAVLQVRTVAGSWEVAALIPSSSEWTPMDVDLSPWAGQVIQLAFVWTGAPPYRAEAADFWRVDAVRVLDALPTATSTLGRRVSRCPPQRRCRHRPPCPPLRWRRPKRRPPSCRQRHSADHNADPDRRCHRGTTPAPEQTQLPETND